MHLHKDCRLHYSLNTPGLCAYIDDLGRVSEVQTLAYIDHMLFFEKKSRLVVLTRTFILAQLEIRSDCKVVPIMKMKVSVAGGSPERGIKHVCWAGPGIIAAATDLFHAWPVGV